VVESGPGIWSARLRADFICACFLAISALVPVTFAKENTTVAVCFTPESVGDVAVDELIAP
jgi:hypothetical protein